MPSKVDKLRINDPKLDKRVKLMPEDKVKIKELFDGGASIHGLSREFHVSRRTIQFIVYPEKYQDNLDLRKARGGWKKYYNKEQNAKYMRDHRAYKEKLLLGEGETEPKAK